MGEKKGIKKKIIGAVGALIAITSLAVGGIINTEGIKIEQYESRAEKGYCTILVYMNGSDLESEYGAATTDLMEMEQAVAQADPEGKEIHIVVEAGGTRQWQYEPMQSYEYGRFVITGSNVSQVEGLDKRDMGRTDTLADFINYGTQSYPAEHYGLIFWNHGAGQIQGFGKDENYNGSSLSLEEIREGLDDSSFNDRFDFVGMDACLMSNIELAALLQDKTDYLITSEDLEPQDGYDYVWMETLIENREDKDYGRRVGENILLSYQKSYEKEKLSVTLSLIDMKYYQQFHNVFDRIMDYMILDEANDENQLFRYLGVMRSEIQCFGQKDAIDISEQVDVMQLFECMAEETLYPKDMYVSLQEAYEQMVVDKVWQGYETEPCGINIYLPSGDNEQLMYDAQAYGTLSFCEEYQTFVNEYAEYLAQKETKSWGIPQQEATDIRLDIPLAQIETIADAYSTVFIQQNGYSYMISADGDVTLDMSGYLKAPKENTFWGLKGEILCLIENYSTDDSTEYLSPVLYKKQDAVWEPCIMSIIFSDDNPDGSVEVVVPMEISKQEYYLEEGDELIPLYPLYMAADSKKESDNAVGDSRIYDNEYYKGNLITMESMESGDGELEKIILEENVIKQYGFLIRDTKLELYYTDFAL